MNFFVTVFYDYEYDYEYDIQGKLLISGYLCFQFSNETTITDQTMEFGITFTNFHYQKEKGKSN